MKITLGSIMSYLVGILLVLMGLALTVQSPLGLVPLLAGVLIIPAVRRQIDERSGISFSRGATAAIGVVGLIAFVAVAAMVAPSIGGGVPGSDIANVTVAANDANPSDPKTSLDVTWNSRAQSAVDPDTDDISSYESDDGQKFLVVRMSMQNTGSEPLDLDPRLIKFESDGVVYDYQGLFGSGNSFVGVTLNPGASYSGWLAYSIPEDATDGELVVNQEAYFQENVSVSFSHDPAMAINMSD